MPEPLCSSPETITTLLIGYIPMQNENLRKSFMFNLSAAPHERCYLGGYIVLHGFLTPYIKMRAAGVDKGMTCSYMLKVSQYVIT